MNTFNRKNISMTLIISLGVIFSVNANAVPTSSIESSISEMVLAQGQQVMNDLTMQLQQSITAEINSFSINFSFDDTLTQSLAWLTEDQTTMTKQTKQ